MRIKLMVVLAMLATAAMAQDKSELARLDWMVGEWKGDALVRMGPGEPQKVVQTEKVQKRADVLLVEGLGKDASGKVVHDALGMIWFDAQKKQVRFNAAAAGKGVHETTIELGESGNIWRMSTPQGQIRYTIRRTEKDEWNEIGEFSRDNGATWMKFFEMTLQRVR